MTPERWQQIQQVFEGAADRPSGERAVWLADACGGDSELRREVESLLAHEAPGAGFLDPLIRDAAGLVTGLVTGDSAEAGRRIGPYRVTGVLGHGGMGTVFLAVRDDDQYRKQVAIKLVRQGMATDFALRRFRQERQILAGLEHPHIARLLEGGTTAEGLPYFAMEYVRGEPITEYCRSRKLPIASRLKLFRQVCSAVQYAHQNLVIHRDLKPSNILVAEDGTPKLLDFGIARLVSSELDETSLPQTVTAMRILTPDYASPEQVRGEPMTTATDVYSLGAVLYELLTDRRPHRFENLSMAAIEQAICTGEVEKPSTAARRDGTMPERWERWRRQLSGDLDTIVGMAMRKEPGRRYASVEQFSEDLRRYLEGLPVLARTDSFGYRTGKLVRRHKLAISAAALVVLSLVGGLAATAYQARRAERRFEQVRKLARTFLFDFHDKIRDLPGSTEARELLVNTSLEYLDSLSAEAEGDLALQLELAEAYQRVGTVQGNVRAASLGHFGTALETHRKALRLVQGVAERQPADLPTLRVLSACYLHVGDLLAGSGDTAGGIAALRQSLEVARRVDARRTGTSGDLLLMIRASEILGDMQLQARDVPGALRSYRTALDLGRRRGKEFPDRTGAVQHSLALGYARFGDALAEQGDLAATLGAYHEALRIREGLVAAFPSNTTYRRELKTLYNWLGNYLGNPGFVNLGDGAAALRYYRQGLVISEEIAAVDPRNVLALYDLTVSYTKVADILTASDPRQAVELYRRALAVIDDLLEVSPGDFKYLRRRALYQRNLAAPLRRLGDQNGALRMLRTALDTSRALAAEKPENAEVQADLHDTLKPLGDLQLEMGDRAAALESYQQALAIAETGGSADLYSLWRLADSYSRLGEYHAADPAVSLAWHQKALSLWTQWPRQGVSSVFDASRREKARLAVARASLGAPASLPAF